MTIFETDASADPLADIPDFLDLKKTMSLTDYAAALSRPRKPAPMAATPVVNQPQEEVTVATKSTKADQLRALREAGKKAKAKRATAPKTKKAAKANGNGKAKNGNGAKTYGGRAGSKRAEVVKLLTRTKGATCAELLDVTGWPTISVPAVAKAAGLKLRKERNPGESTRYFAG